ncbi:type II toxin-antitoxin system HicB family antitoxin [Rhodopseudomonas palustris]|uniref:HicB-like antitoxin of toxin-antitoxin system domain-containing protein n=1 Tax=Rhodopseudomonas palustris (strain BisB18) TaxID=316056 RepID=Q211W4_RHOPB
MPHYIALIHKDPDSCYGVSFPDIAGVITAGDTLDEAMQQATEVLSFAAEDWVNADGSPGFRPPRTIDQLRQDHEFAEDAKDAMIAVIEFPAQAHAAE